MRTLSNWNHLKARWLTPVMKRNITIFESDFPPPVSDQQKNTLQQIGSR